MLKFLCVGILAHTQQRLYVSSKQRRAYLVNVGIHKEYRSFIATDFVSCVNYTTAVKLFQLNYYCIVIYFQSYY